jgi:hypothetical protein
LSDSSFFYSHSFDADNQGVIVGVSNTPCLNDGTLCGGTVCAKLTSPNDSGVYEVDCHGATGSYVYMQLPSGASGTSRLLHLDQFQIWNIPSIPSCSAGHYLDGNNACTAFTTCTLGSTYQTTAPVQTAQNRVCAAVVACDANTDHESVAATLLAANTCATKQCTCTGGVGTSGAACPTHNTAKCVPT